MQCFQKDPNLRVSARKLLRHAWIVGCRRAEAPVSKAPDNFNQAVEEVKQWNKALNSSEPALRSSTGSDFTGSSTRFVGGTPAKGPLGLAKPRLGVEAFKTVEQAGKFTSRCIRRTHWSGTATHFTRVFTVVFTTLTCLADNDNWDDDFVTAISPSALHLPHLKPQDNFGGLLSSDKLKAFASTNDLTIDGDNYDDDFEGELLTIKGPTQQRDEVQEETLRPIHKKAVPSTGTKSHQRTKSTSGKAAAAMPSSSGPKSPSKGHFGGKFELPARPDVVFREQSVEDFSDLFVDNDEAFSHRVNKAVRRVRLYHFDECVMIYPTNHVC